MYRKRFGLHSHPLPKDACGSSFYEGGDLFARLRRVFNWLADEPGLATLTGDAGVGKTAALRHLCSMLPRPEHRVLYICDTHVSATAPTETSRSSWACARHIDATLCGATSNE